MVHKTNKTIKGRRVLRVGANELIAAKGYKLYSYSFINKRWSPYVKLKDGKNSFFSAYSLTQRLTRSEITRFYSLRNESELCIARKGLFLRQKGEKEFRKVFNVIRGSRPMNICENVDGTLYFGEYFANMEKKAVHIYRSTDSGNTWDICYTFLEGNINHVHGIFLDPYTNRMWYATGDRENECIIGYTEDGFKTIKEVFRGGQECRTCVLFFYKDFIVFGTDSQYEHNTIKKIDRITNEITVLQSVQGPVIKGTQIGNISIISTDVEPSDVNKDKKAYIWITRDGEHWEILYSAEKDCLNPTLFQFGVFDLPQYAPDYKGQKLYATGKALKKCGGDTLIFE